MCAVPCHLSPCARLVAVLGWRCAPVRCSLSSAISRILGSRLGDDADAGHPDRECSQRRSQLGPAQREPALVQLTRTVAASPPFRFIGRDGNVMAGAHGHLQHLRDPGPGAGAAQHRDHLVRARPPTVAAIPAAVGRRRDRRSGHGWGCPTGRGSADHRTFWRQGRLVGAHVHRSRPTRSSALGGALGLDSCPGHGAHSHTTARPTAQRRFAPTPGNRGGRGADGSGPALRTVVGGLLQGDDAALHGCQRSSSAHANLTCRAHRSACADRRRAGARCCGPLPWQRAEHHVETLLNRLRALKVPGIDLHASPRNSGALAFYPRVGFTALPAAEDTRRFGQNL